MKTWLFGLAICAYVAPNVLKSQELVYTPINPSFGGSSFNSSHLLATAEPNRPAAPKEDSPFSLNNESSQADLFTRQLESRILAQLSFDIVDKIFNGEAQTGTFQFGTTSLSFDKFLDGSIELVITDTGTGGTTTIVIPSFLTAEN